MRYFNYQKCCATCAYWSGDRTVDFSRTSVDTKNSSGICVGGGRNRGNLPASSSCSKYSKCPQLR